MNKIKLMIFTTLCLFVFSSSVLADAKSALTEKASQCNDAYIVYGQMTIASCKEDGKITTKFTNCKKQADSMYKITTGHISEANSYVSQGLVKESDSEYKNLIDKCTQAKDRIDEFKTALDKASTDDYNEDMGTDIESSVTTKDVKDNDYYREYQKQKKGDGYKDPNLTSDFLSICDASKSPKTLGAFKLGGIFITLAKIIAPVILIVMGMIDISKAVPAGKDDAIKKSFNDFLKRTIAAVLIFFTPSIILAIFTFVDGFDNVESAFSPCMDCLLKPSECQGSIGK